MSDKVVVDATAPGWAHALARLLDKIFSAQRKRIRELEERVKALEAP